jgi:hypothetical protein
MPVNPVSTPIDLIASNSSDKIQHQEQRELHQAHRDVAPDNDNDDQATQATKPTVNTSGQAIGTIINAKA